MNYDSSKNQRIKRQFVSREVIYNVSTLINEQYKIQVDIEDQDILDDLVEKMSYENPVLEYIEDEMTIVQCMECLLIEAGEMPYIGNAKDQLIKYLGENDMFDEFGFNESIDPEYIEVSEHWIVTEWLAEKLKQKGEVVEEYQGLTIWGRQATGQAIFLDGVIDEICNEMEILEGQKREWNI